MACGVLILDFYKAKSIKYGFPIRFHNKYLQKKIGFFKSENLNGVPTEVLILIAIV